MAWFWIALTAMIILGGFVFQKSKIYLVLQIFWIWVLMAFNAGGMDYVGYVAMYNGSREILPRIGSSDYLYGVISYLGNKANLSLLQFDVINTSVGLIILLVIILKFSPRPSIVLSLLMLFPMAAFTIQRRNFLSTVVTMVALIVLKADKKGFSKYIQVAQYILLCLISGGFHNIGYVYLLCLPSKFLSLKQLKYSIFFILAISIAAMPLVQTIAKNLFNSLKVYVYLQDVSFRLEYWKVGVFIVLQCVFCAFHAKIFYKCKETHDVFISKLDRFMLIILPLYYYNSTFFRIYRCILPLQYIEYSKLFDRKYISADKALILKLAYAGWIFAFFIFSYVATGQFGFGILIKWTIFEENYLLNLITPM